MAIITTNRANLYVHAVYEDPRPSSARIYINEQGFTKNALSAVVDSHITHSPSGVSLQTFGYPSVNAQAIGGTGTDTTTITTGVLFLTGEITHVQHQFVGVNDQRCNMDLTPFISMDPNRRAKNHRYEYDASTGNNSIISLYQDFYSQQSHIWELRYNASGEIDTPQARPTSVTTSTNSYRNLWAVYRNPTTNYLVYIGNYYNSGTRNIPGSPNIIALTNVFTPSPTFNAGVDPTSQGLTHSTQFIGVSSVDGRAIFFRNNFTTDYDQIVYKYLDYNNTFTTLLTISTAPSAIGTNGGGNRATTFGGYSGKYASSTFSDPTSAGNQGFYLPYFDVNGRYHPFFVQWNVSTDVFTRNNTTSVTYPGANTMSTYWTVDQNMTTGVSVTYGNQRVWYNETFTNTVSSTTTRYLTLFQLHGGGNAYDADPKQRTFITYSMTTGTPTTLVYHSSVIIPLTPKNIVWLNDARTTVGVFTHINFYVYTFDPAGTNGWVLTSTIPYQLNAVGRDSLNRIWAADVGPNQMGRIHLITPSVPATVSFVTAASSYNYAGSTINSTGALNAYDVNGNRMAVSVTLTVTGSSLVLVNSSSVQVTTLTVTTSTSADTTVNIAIIAAGNSSVVTSVNV